MIRELKEAMNDRLHCCPMQVVLSRFSHAEPPKDSFFISQLRRTEQSTNAVYIMQNTFFLQARPQKLVRPKRPSSKIVLNEPVSKELPPKRSHFRMSIFRWSDFTYSSPSSARLSLAAIDVKYIDHLVGPDTKSSRLDTRDRLVVESTNVLELPMAICRDILKKQSEITGVSNVL